MRANQESLMSCYISEEKTLIRIQLHQSKQTEYKEARKKNTKRLRRWEKKKFKNSQEVFFFNSSQRPATIFIWESPQKYFVFFKF